MMKFNFYFSLIVLVLLSLVLCTCTSNQYLIQSKQGKVIDKRLVGKWVVNYNKTLKEGEKSWLIERKEDGCCIIIIKTNENNNISQTIEKGIWWVDCGEIFLLLTKSQDTINYQYDIRGKDCIEYTTTPTDKPTLLNQSFTDIKFCSIAGNCLKNAIVVKNEIDQNTYISKNFPNSKILQKEVINAGNKKYEKVVIKLGWKTKAIIFEIKPLGSNLLAD